MVRADRRSPVRRQTVASHSLCSLGILQVLCCSEVTPGLPGPSARGFFPPRKKCEQLTKAEAGGINQDDRHNLGSLSRKKEKKPCRWLGREHDQLRRMEGEGGKREQKKNIRQEPRKCVNCLQYRDEVMTLSSSNVHCHWSTKATEASKICWLSTRSSRPPKTQCSTYLPRKVPLRALGKRALPSLENTNTTKPPGSRAHWS